MEALTGINADGSLSRTALVALLADAVQHPDIYALLRNTRYRYDPATGQWYDRKGATVDVAAMIEARIDAAVQRLENVYRANPTNGTTFGNAMAAELRNAHLEAYIIGLGGLPYVRIT